MNIKNASTLCPCYVTASGAHHMFVVRDSAWAAGTMALPATIVSRAASKSAGKQARRKLGDLDRRCHGVATGLRHLPRSGRRGRWQSRRFPGFCQDDGERLRRGGRVGRRSLSERRGGRFGGHRLRCWADCRWRCGRRGQWRARAGAAPWPQAVLAGILSNSASDQGSLRLEVSLRAASMSALRDRRRAVAPFRTHIRQNGRDLFVGQRVPRRHVVVVRLTFDVDRPLDAVQQNLRQTLRRVADDPFRTDQAAGTAPLDPCRWPGGTARN